MAEYNNDAVRDALLRYLFQVNQKARSVKAAAQGIRDIQAGMKTLGFKQQEVASNLDYLIQKGWVREVVEQRSFRTKSGTLQPSEKRTYKISDIGMDKLQAASMYSDVPSSPRVNITNVNGVTVVGDGNIVNTTYSNLFRVLSEMKQQVLSASTVSDTAKVETGADIASLLGQLQKPKPDSSIVKKLWKSIEATVTAAGFAELVRKGADLIRPLL